MKNELFEMYRLNAIKNWENKKNGIYQWWEEKRYTPDYCQTQIEYFKKLTN